MRTPSVKMTITLDDGPPVTFAKDSALTAWHSLALSMLQTEPNPRKVKRMVVEIVPELEQ